MKTYGLEMILSEEIKKDFEIEKIEKLPREFVIHLVERKYTSFRKASKFWQENSTQWL